MEKSNKKRNIIGLVIFIIVTILAILAMEKTWNLLIQNVKERKQHIIEKRKKRRNMIGFAIITVVIILVTSNFVWYKIDELKEAKLKLQNIEDSLSSVQDNLENASSRAIEDFHFTDNLIEQYIQKLESAKIKLSEVEKLLSELENCEKPEMRAIYENARAKMDEVRKLLQEVDIDYMLSTRDDSILKVSYTCDREETKLETIHEALQNWDYDRLDIGEAYNRYNEMCEIITSIRD